MDIVWQAEDNLREKKVESDLKDLLKTLVAFANSVGPSDTAQIFIGEKDDGTVQGVSNTDNIQKRVREEAEKIYPEIYYRTEVYERDGKRCVRVDIKHNGLAPHFGGQAWVRRGSETKKATEDIYEQFIALRSSKARTLEAWLDKTITAHWRPKRAAIEVAGGLYLLEKEQARIIFVGQHWATFQIFTGSNWSDRTEPMERLLLSWDDDKIRLKVIIQLK